jgi:hypothetical protein
MSEHTKTFIDQLQAGNNVEAGDAFKAALRDKVGDQLDIKRKEMAATMFNGTIEAQSFSDPKPEIADPGTFNQDGSVNTGVQGNDGQAEIDLTQTNEPTNQ